MLTLTQIIIVIITAIIFSLPTFDSNYSIIVRSVNFVSQFVLWFAISLAVTVMPQAFSHIFTILIIVSVIVHVIYVVISSEERMKNKIVR
jgi:hypothetical protein